jgi:hypothetical protein
MNINRRDMFITPVWEVDTGFDKAFNIELLAELNRYYQGGAGPADSNIWTCDSPLIKQLNKTILDVVKNETLYDVAQNYGSPDDVVYIHTRGWMNYHKPGESLSIHGHGGSKISATYYVNAPEGCGDLILIDPRGAVDWEKGLDGCNGSKFNRVKPREGMLVFFPSYVLHTVERNNSTAPRISLTTDISTITQSSIQYFADSIRKGTYNVL